MKFIPIATFVKHVKVHKANPVDKPKGAFSYDELPENIQEKIMDQAAADAAGSSYHFSPPFYCYNKEGEIACQDDGSAIRIH